MAVWRKERSRRGRGSRRGRVGTLDGWGGLWGSGPQVSARGGHGSGPNAQVNNAKEQQILSVLLTERKTLERIVVQLWQWDGQMRSFSLPVGPGITPRAASMPGGFLAAGLSGVRLPISVLGQGQNSGVETPVNGLDGVQDDVEMDSVGSNSTENVQDDSPDLLEHVQDDIEMRDLSEHVQDIEMPDAPEHVQDEDGMEWEYTYAQS